MSTTLETTENPNALAIKHRQQVILETTPIVGQTSIAQIVELAKIMSASGFWPEAKTAQQSAALMILGQQFGLSAVQSLTGIHIVKGKPMLHYSAILAKVRQHPDYDYKINEHTEKLCAIEFFRFGESCGISTFTAEDARKAGTQNMEKHGKTMLLARAASNGVKWYCPDVLNGMPVYTEGEVPSHDEFAERPTSINDRVKADLMAQQASAGDVIELTEDGDVPDETEEEVPPTEGVDQPTLTGDGPNGPRD